MFLSIRQPVIAAVLATLFILLMLPQPGSATLQANSSALPVPDPRLQPEDVVKIVLDALANNDTPYTLSLIHILRCRRRG